MILHKTVSRDRWGKEEMSQGVELTKVRLEPSGKIIRNSRPRDMVLEVDDIVVFQGQKFSVQTAEPLYDGKRLHHYEMGLVKHA